MKMLNIWNIRNRAQTSWWRVPTNAAIRTLFLRACQRSSRKSPVQPMRTFDSDEESVEKETMALTKKDFKEDSKSRRGNLFGDPRSRALAYQNKDRLKRFEKIIDCIFSVYEALANMCQVREDNRLEATTIMLSGDALKYHSANVKTCPIYGVTVNFLCSWYYN